MAKPIIVNSKYIPISYDEMFKPLQDSTLAYKEMQKRYEDEINNLSDWAFLANDPRNKNLYEEYLKQESDLIKARDSLINEGLTSKNMQDLLIAKRNYNNVFKPLKEVKDKLDLYTNKQLELQESNPYIVYNTDYKNLSLSDMSKLNKEGYNSFDGSVLAKNAANMASKFLDSIITINDKKLSVGDYIVSELQNGLTLEEALTGLSKRSGVSESYKEIQDSVLNSFNINDENWSKDKQDIAKEFIRNGMLEGVGKLTRNVMKDNNLALLNYTLDRDKFDWNKKIWEDEHLGTLLPDGRRIKDIGSGRTRILYPDGRIEILSNNASKNSNSKNKIFSGLQFKMWNNKGATTDFLEGLSNKRKYTKEGFYIGDEEKISFNNLSAAMRTNIIAKLAEYGLTLDDVELWRDKDVINDNHYQIRLKENKGNKVNENNLNINNNQNISNINDSIDIDNFGEI